MPLLIREDYLKIIEEIRNLEKRALDGYIKNKLIPLQKENDFFIETLYKDVIYVLKNVDESGDNDEIIENGDWVMEDDDFKLTGYQTRLHDIIIWLHSEVCRELIEKNPFTFSEKMEQFEKSVLEKDNYTVEYRKKLNEINRSIIKERNENYATTKPVKKFIGRIFDLDNWNLKFKVPFIGIEINFKGIIKNFQSKNHTVKEEKKSR